MSVPYSPLAIANRFIETFGQDDGIEHMKLQKLVYCSYGWWLAAKGLNSKRLTRTGPEVWKHGPVFSDLYKILSVYGREPLTIVRSTSPFGDPETVDVDDLEVIRLIEWVWGRYGHLSSYSLSEMTHKPGTPWHRVATDNDFLVPRNCNIPDEYIFEEFTKLLNDFKGVTLSSSSKTVEGDDKREYA